MLEGKKEGERGRRNDGREGIQKMEGRKEEMQIGG